MLLDLRHSRSMCKGSKKDDLFYTVIYFYVICSCQTLLKLFNWLRSYRHTHIAQRHKPYFLRKPWLFPCRKHGLFLRFGMHFGKASQSRSVILWSFSGRSSKAFQQLSLRYRSMSDLSPTSLVSSFCVPRSPRCIRSQLDITGDTPQTGIGSSPSHRCLLRARRAQGCSQVPG